MSNGKNALARLFKLWAKVSMMVVDRKRDPKMVADALQKIIDNPQIEIDPRFNQIDEFEVVVPKDYDHTTRLTTFEEAQGKEFSFYHEAITDPNFTKVTTKLIPGRKFMVKVFQIKKTVSSEDCLAFLKNQQAVLVGAQGATLAYEQGKDKLPIGRWSISFDEKNALPFVDGCHRVPCVHRVSGGDSKFFLDRFDYDWRDVYYLLCFCDLSARDGLITGVGLL